MTERKWGKCSYCKRFIENLTSSICGQCTNEFDSYKERNDPKRYAPRYVIVTDPQPVQDGGFRSGAGFSTNDHKANIKFEAYSPGTVILDTYTNCEITI